MSPKRKLFVPILMFIVRIVVTLYTYLTLPFYYCYQKPWNKVAKTNRCRAKKENPKDPNSAWIRNDKKVTHPLMVANTLSESLSKLANFYGVHSTILGYREVLSAEDSIGKDGKIRRIDGKSLKKYKLSEYKWLTYGQVDTISRNIAKGLLANGVNYGDKVLLLSETRVEWFLCAQAIAKLGATIVTLFSNLGDDGIVHGMNQTEIKVMITSSDLLPKVKSLLSQTPTVSTIVYINGYETPNTDDFPQNINLISLKEIEKTGSNSEFLFQVPKPDDTLIIMYTSGTTGIPKAAVATNRQFLASFNAFLTLIKDVVDDYPRHTYIAYLPLAHVLELTVEFFLFHGGVKIGYGSPFTLTDSAPGLVRGQKCDIKLLRPTCITTVPLVLDRIRKEIRDKLESRTSFSVDIFNYLMAYKTKWTEKGYKCQIVNKLLCSKVKEQMGGRLQYMIVGGAPLNADTQAVIKAALDVTLCQGYGATETTGAVLCMDFDDLSYGRVGGILQGVKVKLISWDEGNYHPNDKPNPRGEILIGGDCVSVGYYGLPQETQEAFKIDDLGVRWFHTGDIGEMFPNGTFKVIDRRKDLLKLQNGEYVSLGKIEAALKSCQYVDNICVCGGTFSNNLMAIITPNQKSLSQLAESLGKKESLTKLCEDPDINKEVYSSLSQAGISAHLSKKEIPIKIKLVADEWSPDNDLLTAAMKLKRKNVEKKYKKEIDRMFSTEVEKNLNNNNNNNIKIHDKV